MLPTQFQISKPCLSSSAHYMANLMICTDPDSPCYKKAHKKVYSEGDTICSVCGIYLKKTLVDEDDADPGDPFVNDVDVDNESFVLNNDLMSVSLPASLPASARVLSEKDEQIQVFHSLYFILFSLLD